MLIFLDARLAYLATPKTATTAIEIALRRRADIVLQRGRKHMPARRFAKKVAPFIKDTFDLELETVAIMREPLDHLRSWYSYRTREEKIEPAKSTSSVSFDKFIADLMAKRPPDYARINGQYSFLCENGVLRVTHLFAYPNIDEFRAFMAKRLKTNVKLDVHNVSPGVDTSLCDKTFDRLRRARAAEFELYDRLIASGGYLHTAGAVG